MRIFVIFFCCTLCISTHAQIKILFDASQAEMAGNADWIIDANTFNIGFNSGGAAVAGSGNESNPQINPSPAQSGITSGTAESYWTGALSSWAIDLVKMGYQVSTLPYNGVISYGNSGNAQDLSNYKVFIVCEPNIRFTAAERTALINFVQNGGGLFMISDHTISDRNGDGWDSPEIWNDLMTNNSVQVNPFGISFDLEDISNISYNTNTAANDTITNGPAGVVSGVKFSNGTMITIDPVSNPSARGIIYNASSFDNDSIMLACSNYGSGRVAALGDSSPADDGTGDNNDVLYYGYTDFLGYHRKMLLNTTVWLAGNYSTTFIPENDEENVLVYPNPARDRALIDFKSSQSGSVSITDIEGRQVYSKIVNKESKVQVDLDKLVEGMYFIYFSSENLVVRRKLVVH